MTNYLQQIEKEIRQQPFGRKPESLYEPIRYLMALGGKRLRPMLVMLAYRLYRSDVSKIVPYAVAVEAFHNFTLMHDDIMDKAPLRRGKPTVHKKWNVNTAILSGDVMLVKVYELFARLKPQLLRQVLEAFNACATEVCEGQQWDMEFETRSTVTEKEYIHMIRQKTAVLLGFSLELGALLAEAPEADRKALRNLGISIGIGFQLTDDLLDAYADPKKFGKQVGGDIVANKKTYLLIKAWQLATPQQRKTLHHWLTAKSPDKKEKVSEVKKIFDALDLEKITQRKSQSYFQKGLTQLNHLHIPDQQRESLRSYIRELIHRQV